MLTLLSRFTRFCLHSVCSAKFDLLFILDSSSSIGQASFNVMKDFVMRLVDTFEIGRNQVQVSICEVNLEANFPHLSRRRVQGKSKTHFMRSAVFIPAPVNCCMFQENFFGSWRSYRWLVPRLSNNLQLETIFPASKPSPNCAVVCFRRSRSYATTGKWWTYGITTGTATRTRWCRWVAPHPLTEGALCNHVSTVSDTYPRISRLCYPNPQLNATCFTHKQQG